MLCCIIAKKIKKDIGLKKVVLASVVTAMALYGAGNDKLFVSHVELGYVQTNGNTDTKTFNLDGNIKKDIDKHSLKLSFDGQYAENDGEENKNKYKIIGDYLYNFSDVLGFGYMIGYKDDKFSGFDYQFTTGPFVKWTALKDKVQTLAFDLGILYAKDKIEAGDTNDYASGALALEYTYQILENLKFSENASYRTDLSDTDNSFIFSKTAITTKLSDIFSAGVSYKIDYAQTPPAGKKHTDSTFAVNLIVDY